jgi:7-carboxy-7-deazaguanine synthase
MTGTVCHFIRLSGCNMWDGRPETRAQSLCPFCDTDFLSHTMLTADQIAAQLAALGRVTWVTISGGEPALQVDRQLIDVLHDQGFKVAVESNGTRTINTQVDHLTISPKLPPDQTVVTSCDTLKVLFPHPDPRILPEGYDGIRATTRYIQPIDAEDPVKSRHNLERALAKVYSMPGWKLSIQTHKLIEVE